MSLRIQNSRQLLKRSDVSGATPTVNTSSTQHTDGTWTVDEIYAGELYWNMQDIPKKLYLGWEDISGNTGVELIYPQAGTPGPTFTGGSSNCIADFYVSNIFGCSPINLFDKMFIQTGVTFASSDDTSFIAFDSGGVGLIDIQTQAIGGTLHQISMDSPGDAMSMVTTATGGEFAAIDLAYDSGTNKTSIQLRTEDNSFTEASSINMTKDGITLFSTDNTGFISSGSTITVVPTGIGLLSSREIFAVTPEYVYHTNTNIISGNANTIFYHLEKTTTTGATPITLYTIPFTPNNSVMTIKAIINGNTVGGGSGYGCEYFGVFKNVAGTVTLLSTLDKSDKTDFTTADTNIIISGTDIIIQVTGEAATNINWVTRFNYTISI